jgi:hypothetical protein
MFTVQCEELRIDRLTLFLVVTMPFACCSCEALNKLVDMPNLVTFLDRTHMSEW